MLIKIQPKTLLQMVCEFTTYSKVTFKCIKGSDIFFSRSPGINGLREIEEYSLSKGEVRKEGYVILAGFLRQFAKFLHHPCVTRRRRQEEKPTEILRLVQTFLSQTKLTLLRGQLRKLLPFLFRLKNQMPQLQNPFYPTQIHSD